MHTEQRLRSYPTSKVNSIAEIMLVLEDKMWLLVIVTCHYYVEVRILLFWLELSTVLIIPSPHRSSNSLCSGWDFLRH